MEIKVNASTMVKPAVAAPATTVWISNLDVIMPAHFHILTVYFYRPSGGDGFFDPAVLKASLSRALVEFYPFAGRLNKLGADGRIEINCNGEGALFVEADCDGEVDHFHDFSPTPDHIDLIPKVDYSQGISTFPLLLVQVTRFKCGGVGLGFANEHHLVDGFAGNHFINTWAEIARGVDISTKPFLDRRLLAARNPPQPKFPHVEYLPPPALKNPKQNSEEMIFSVFKLTRHQLNALKAKCIKDVGGNLLKYSTYETLAGHVWRCVSEARKLPKDEESKLYIPLDGRSRVEPRLPPGYFGNVVFKATTSALCGELESNPLEFAVRKIHEAIARMDDEYLRSAIDFLEVHGELDPRARGASAYMCPNLAVVSWARFAFFTADFGWGIPVRLGFGGTPPEGNTIVLPGTPDNTGGLSYAIVLPKDQMQAFQKLFYQI